MWKVTHIVFNHSIEVFIVNVFMWLIFTGFKKLTYKIQESESDQKVGCPIEAVRESKGPPSDGCREYFTQEEPRHWEGKKKKKENQKMSFLQKNTSS